MGEVAAEFPGHDAGDGLGAEIDVGVGLVGFILVSVCGGVVEGVELLAYGEEVGVCTPGSDCVARHGSRLMKRSLSRPVSCVYSSLIRHACPACV